MAGGGDDSSEEFVEDDSACGEEEEEDGDSSASFESEEDEDDDDDGATGDDSDVFETPIKARKRARTPSQQPATAATAAPSSSSVGGSTGANGGTAAGKKGPAGAGASGSAPKTPKAAVSDYMLQSNRPYSYINVFDNLRKKIPKAMVQKLLDELVRDGTLKLQEYGKARIYYANQDALPNGAGDASADKMRTLDQEAKTLTSQLEIVSKQEQQTRARASSLSCQPTDDELTKKLANCAQELEQAEARNGAAKGQGRSVAAGGMKTAKQSFNKFRALWVTRKRNAMDVVDMIADGMEKKPKVVMEMLGVEPDEDPIPPKM
ncbi:TBPIP domain containing protein [Ectocarpus siliculosus]|uniref:Homologous-pairing protein 2 homolog n=1 Tax=Ectocarpus siliculosus TaxID=2880 RepID=D7G4U2_ECTSI|nr:TBPIP domain containing protein [Ectocarpus siliculosus]|eukprot:CBJ27185.1 TBPIP domain containing protein [Ectocarpus siliculosus]